MTVAVSGAQTQTAACPTYRAEQDAFTLSWKTARSPLGAATITVAVTYPGAPPQSVSVPVVLARA